MNPDRNDYPPGFDAEKVKRVVRHYENQTDEQAAAEDDAAFEQGVTAMPVPYDLVPEVQRLIDRHERRRAG